MGKVKDRLLAIKVPGDFYNQLEKASELDGRKIPDFVRHYLKMTVESIIAVRGQKEILKLFSDEKTISKMMKELSKQ